MTLSKLREASINGEMDKITSPVPAKKAIAKKMDFPDALRAIFDGHKVTKLEWNNKEIYGVLIGGYLMLKLVDGRYHEWLIKEGDFLGGEDYVIVD